MILGVEMKLKPIVDLSFWQPPDKINYDILSTEISGAILRGAYGIWKDTGFDKHYKELHDRGVPIGAYHYIVGNKTGKEQAVIFNLAVYGKELKLGLWDDVEDRRDITHLYAPIVNEYHYNIEMLTGKTVGIYTGQYAWFEIMGTQAYKYSDRPLWMSWPSISPIQMPIGSKWTTWLFHQYSFSGKFEGVPGDIDKNNFNGTEEQYRRYFNLDEIIPEPTQPEPPTIGVILPTLKVINDVRVRTEPSTRTLSTTIRMRKVGEIVNVEEIKINSNTNIWVRDREGWSAVFYSGWQYME